MKYKVVVSDFNMYKHVPEEILYYIGGHQRLAERDISFLFHDNCAPLRFNSLRLWEWWGE